MYILSMLKVLNHYVTIFFLPQLLQLKGTSEKYDTMIEKVINRVQTNVAWYKKERNEVTVELLKK